MGFRVFISLFNDVVQGLASSCGQGLELEWEELGGASAGLLWNGPCVQGCDCTWDQETIRKNEILEDP